MRRLEHGHFRILRLKTPNCYLYYFSSEIRCGEPPLPPNSIISVTLNDRSATRSLITATPGYNLKQTFRLGSVIRIRCERGYKMVGESALRTCVDGEWSGETPSCQYVDCGEPASIQNGKYELSSNTTFLGSSSTYECDAGWKLIGRKRVICREDGKWSGTASCQGSLINSTSICFSIL